MVRSNNVNNAPCDQWRPVKVFKGRRIYCGAQQLIIGVSCILPIFSISDVKRACVSRVGFGIKPRYFLVCLVECKIPTINTSISTRTDAVDK